MAKKTLAESQPVCPQCQRAHAPGGRYCQPLNLLAEDPEPEGNE